MRRRRQSALRGLVELVLLVAGIALIGLAVGLARGAELQEGEQVSPQVCAELATRREAFGLAIGDRVIDRITIVGELQGFACDARMPIGIVQSGRDTLRRPLATLRPFPRVDR